VGLEPEIDLTGGKEHELSVQNHAVVAIGLGFRERVAAYAELAKPRLSTLLLIVAVATYFAAGGKTVSGALVTLITVGMLAAGIFALNQYFERVADAAMMRTRGRPIPSGRVEPVGALVMGIVGVVAALFVGILDANVITGVIAIAVVVSYLGIYTPLKQVTPLHTMIGAIPGAAPPLIGWAVATGTLPPDAWILFGVLFLWQFPHFFAIEIMYAEDYRRAGIQIFPNRKNGWLHLSAQLLASHLLLVGLTALPYLTGLSGTIVYLVGAAVLSAAYLAAGVLVVATRQKRHARLLLRASVMYLPLLYTLICVAR